MFGVTWSSHDHERVLSGPLETGDSPECQLNRGLYWAQLTNERVQGTHNLNSEHNTTCNGATEQSRWSSQARCWVIKGTLDCVFTDSGGPDHEKFPCSRAQYVDRSVLHDLCQSGVIIRHTPVQQCKPTPLSIWIEQSGILYMHDAWPSSLLLQC